MRSFIIFLLIVFAFCGQAFSQQVNGFTGNFSYGASLMTVPSSKGNGISIGASYNSGIKVKQQASEIGLGWSLSAGGAIYRYVSGLPDDCYGCQVFDASVASTTISQNGALYTPGDADLYRTSRNMDSLEFTFPDYDYYSVSGPGINGLMSPYIFDYQMYTKGSNSQYTLDPGYPGKGKVPQFNFKGDFADTLISRHFSVTPTSSTTPYHLPGSGISGLGYTSSNEPYLGKSVNGSSITAQNFDPTTNRLGSANYVEYFTNAQIAAIGGTVNIPGFIDFQAPASRSVTASYPAAGIGAFRITDPTGFVYHYSLPVYILKTETHNYPLENDYSVPSFSTTLANYSSAANSYTWTLNSNVTTKKIIQNMYAYQWLMTAITGPDYVDSNSNHLVDDGDAGYWVSFDYKPWSNNYVQRVPQYGFDYFFDLDETTKRLPVYQPTNSSTLGINFNKLSGKQGQVSLTYQQDYYLNKIKTGSHTAIFVHDIRKDEVSGNTATTVTGTLAPTPKLKLTRIALFKNDRLDSIVTSAPTTTFTESNYSAYSFSNTVNSSNNFYTESWFNTNLNSYIKNRILNHVEFGQDYSLCKNYHGNVEAGSYTTSVVTPPSAVQSSLSVGTYSSSGKLTLNKITSYELQNVKVTPSYIFDYNASVSTDNPDYDPRKTDYWGYYKSDVTTNGYSGYTSSVSKDYTDAWSLRKITEPLGGITEIEYESNSYKKVLDPNSTLGYRGATFVFPIATVSLTGGCTLNCNNIDVYLEESSTPNELAPLLSGTISGLSVKACIPLGYVNLNGPLGPPGYPDLMNYPVWSYYGDVSFTGSSSPLTISSVEQLGQQLGSCTTCFVQGATPNFAPAGGSAIPYDIDSYTTGDFPATYSGNGYMLFQTPATYEVYGDGVRVKNIKSTNAALETYVKQYIYEDGVASTEADRFEYPQLKTGCGQSFKWLDKLKAFSGDKHMISPMIGYSKVTLKNLGQINTSNGSVVTQYITSNPVSGSTALPYFSVIQTHTVNGTDYLDYFECIDKFSPYWGLTKETDVFDVNNNMMSKTTYDYETTDQGAIVENFVFRDPFAVRSSLTVNHDQVCLLRQYPVTPKITTSYGMGTMSTSETLKKDEVTGEATLVRNTGQNGSISMSYKVPAFRISNYADMGPKSVNSSHENNLTAEASFFSAVDTAITPVSSGMGSSFLSALSQAFTQQANVRTYNGGGNVFSVQTTTLNYWKPGVSYGWSGIPGSIDDYGLYKRSELISNPFNFTAPTTSNSAHWRLGSETTLNDEFGHALEKRNASNRFSATKFCNSGDYVLASCSNANYASFTFCGFESTMPGTSGTYAEGEVYLNTGAGSGTIVPVSTFTPHTGYSCLATTGNGMFYEGKFSNNGTYDTEIQRGRLYRAIVWVNASANSGSYLSATVTGSIGGVAYSRSYTMYANDTKTISIGNWKRLYVEFKVPPDIVASSTNGISISVASGGGTAYFDDLLFYPVEAGVKGNIYNPGNGRLVAEINGLGYATLYTYDALGRILDTKQEIPGSGLKLVKINSYNYARTN